MDASKLNSMSMIGNFNPDLLHRTYKLNLMNEFMNAKLNNPKKTQDQIAKSIGTSVSTIQRIRRDIDMQSPYRYDRPLTKGNSKRVDTQQNTEHKEPVQGTRNVPKQVKKVKQTNELIGNARQNIYDRTTAEQKLDEYIENAMSFGK